MNVEIRARLAVGHGLAWYPWVATIWVDGEYTRHWRYGVSEEDARKNAQEDADKFYPPTGTAPAADDKENTMERLPVNTGQEPSPETLLRVRIASPVIADWIVELIERADLVLAYRWQLKDDG